MDVITMPSTALIIQNLKNKYPQFIFSPSDNFYWSYSDKTIFYNEKLPNFELFILHELAHAILQHNKYTQDIQLIAMERQAWDYTIKLAKSLKIKAPESIIQSSIDSYRDWMHSRSTCPKCTSTGLQIDKKNYKCPACDHVWAVNEARICSLKRYSLKTS